MRLLTGPERSGKTEFLLDRLREALRAGDGAVRLLTPTATLAQHLQNRIAREGFVLRDGIIQTLSAFIEDWAGDLAQVAEPTLYLIVEEAVRRVNRPEFAEVARLPGFCASLARTAAEFSAAGCDSAQLARCLPAAPLAAAFLAVYKEVDRELDRRGLATRAQRLGIAARKIEREGLGPIRTVWLDGFHALPDPELGVIAALSRHAEVTLALSDADATPYLRARLGAESRHTLARHHASPAVALFRAPCIERECDEIARRILEQAAAGRPFREIGIVVRAAEAYVATLRAALERFGIPARFYFDSRLERHPAVRFLRGAVEAMLGGWDHAQTLAVLRLAPRFADFQAMDRFDFEVREQVPNAGLGALEALLVDAGGAPLSTGAERLLRKMNRLAAIEEWRSFVLSPKDWARQLRDLRALFRPAPPAPGANHEQALEWRSQAAALDLFEEALDEAAAALDPARQLPLEEFWSAFQAVLRLKPLRLADARRNVVHVLSAPEARQWQLPVVFVCGMTEKHFPQSHRQDVFFPDDARRALNAAGLRVRTAEEFQREERALFDSAITRGSMLVTLSYPEFNARGERNLPSIFLEDLMLPPEGAVAVRPRPGRAPSAAPSFGISDARLLDLLREKTSRLSPTALETYFKCPFHFLGARVLRLGTRPPRPEDRLDFLTQGNIVHATLAEWYAGRPDIAALFERIFERAIEEVRIPPGYHLERLRFAMLEDLRAFAADEQWPRAGLESRMEQAFVFDLDGSVRISGKIDRLDVTADGRAWVIDYKYSGVQRTRQRLYDENLLQPPLYALAAQRSFGLRPAGMFYAGLKGGVTYAGWSDEPIGGLRHEPVPEDWLERAAARTLRAVDEIRAGRVAPAPANPAGCEYCDFGDVCRLTARRTAAVAEGA